PANRVDRAQMMLVPFLRRQTAVQPNAEAGAEEGLLDIVRGQGVARKEDVEEAELDEFADVLDAAGVDDGGAEHREDLFARRLRALHGGGDLAHGDALGL